MPRYLAVAAYYDESNGQPYGYHWTLSARTDKEARSKAVKQSQSSAFLSKHFLDPEDPIFDQGGFDDVYVVPLGSLT